MNVIASLHTYALRERAATGPSKHWFPSLIHRQQNHLLLFEKCVAAKMQPSVSGNSANEYVALEA